MQRHLDAHSGLPVPSSSSSPQHIFMKNDQLSVRVDKYLLSEIESDAKQNPRNMGRAAFEQLLVSFKTAHVSIESHVAIFVRWVPERISALQEVAGVLVGCGFPQQVSFCNDLDRISSLCESALQLTERFPAILANCRSVQLPARLCNVWRGEQRDGGADLVPLDSKNEPSMSLFKFLTQKQSLKEPDAERYWEDRVARLKDAGSTNAKEARDTRSQYDSEIRKCEDLRGRLKDCFSRSQQIASSVIVDQQCLADSQSELEQACSLIAAVLLSVRVAQNVMRRAQVKENGIIQKFDSKGHVFPRFMKWKTDLEIFDHAPHCLEAFITEVRQRRAYHSCLAAFEEMILSRLEAVKVKETARRADFETRFSAHMPHDFRDMLLGPVPVLRIEKRLPPCGIHQLDEHESLPINAWLQENSLDFSSSNCSVKTDFAHAATLTDDKAFVDVGTDTMQLEEDDVRAPAAEVLVQEQEALLRSQFDAEVSGYQEQLSEIQRTKDTQFFLQTTVIMAIIEALQLPEGFPVFPDCRHDFSNSSNHGQVQQFLSAFQSHMQLKHAERQRMQAESDRNVDKLKQMQAELDSLKNASADVRESGSQLHLSDVMYADTASPHGNSPQQRNDAAELARDAAELARLRAWEQESARSNAEMEARRRAWEQEVMRTNAEMEDRLRDALTGEEQMKLERDGAMEQIARIQLQHQQQIDTIMRELRQQQEGRFPQQPHQPPRFANLAPEKAGGGATLVQLAPPLHQPPAAEQLSPKHIESDSMLATLIEMEYEPQRASKMIAAMSVQGKLPTLEEVLDRLNSSS